LRTTKTSLLLLGTIFSVPAGIALAADPPTAKKYTNSIGMELVRVGGGAFQMGQTSAPIPFDLMPLDAGPGHRMDALVHGDFDEKPVHDVTITRAFHMGAFEVTNKQFELFDPDHRAFRGKHPGISEDDSEAVVNVSWYEASAFCEWLSEVEGLPYRLPTEGEWEYACRAGTTSNFSTGEKLPKSHHNMQWLVRDPEPVDLHVGRHPANPWGLHDLHGNVEEWCADWYGPYQPAQQTDPVGAVSGRFRVTRGGSNGTHTYYLRSSNRMGALPEDQNWRIGFRVVLGPLPTTPGTPAEGPPLNQQNVVQRDPKTVRAAPDSTKPYFAKPKPFVRIPPDARGPVFALHNHDPAIVECPNGDILACWYSCLSEKNRELTQAASRLRWGTDSWDEASPFWDVPDRNDHAPAMWFDGKETIYHFSGLCFAGAYGHMVIILRTSKDSGATWSRARVIVPQYSKGHMPVEAVFRLQDNSIAVTSDGSPSLWISGDEGISWKSGVGAIRGNHPGVVQLTDGNLLALTRDVSMEDRMPTVTSTDGGKSWDYVRSEFPVIHGGQRLVLMRLAEGPLFFASFADHGIDITDASGVQRSVRGLFAAVSLDEGKTWPYRRLVTDDGPGMPVESLNGGLYTMSARIGEHIGYMAGCQGTNGVIHLISSRTHYAFNLAWLKTPAPALKHPPLPLQAVKESFDGPTFDNEGWVTYKSYIGAFNGKGQFSIDAEGRDSGINRIVGEGSFEARFVLKAPRFHPKSRRGLQGVALMFQDGLSAKQGVYIRRGDIGMSEGADITYDKPPHTVKIKTSWNLETRRWRVFYGLNGDEPIHELPRSEKGITLEKPFTEATACYILAAGGGVDVDSFEVGPLPK